MSISDVLAIVLFGGFGLWWVFFPVAVIRFYSWFHRERVQLPSPAVVRFMGVGWLLLFGLVMIFGRPHHA